VARISQKRASSERQAEETENGEEHGRSAVVALPAIGGLIEQGPGFTGGTRLLFGGLRGLQRAHSFKIDIVKDSFDGVVGGPREGTHWHGRVHRRAKRKEGIMDTFIIL
jgi:hypothetical protein